MANVREKMIKRTGKLFDKRRKLVANKNAPNRKLIFLQTSGRTSAFIELLTIESGIISRTTRFRNDSMLEVATLDDISQVVSKSSHVALDGQLYVVEKADIVPPNDTRFTWSIPIKALLQYYP